MILFPPWSLPVFSAHKEQINTSMALTVFPPRFSLRCRVPSGKSVTCTCATCAARKIRAADSAASNEESGHIIPIYHGFVTDHKWPVHKIFLHCIVCDVQNFKYLFFFSDFHLQTSSYLLCIFSHMTFRSTKTCKFVSKIDFIFDTE